MNIMNQLTKKHMIVNKKRTIMTILGVIVSVAMITAVSIGTGSFMDLLQRMEISDTGRWHEKFQPLPMSQVTVLEEEDTIESTFYTQELSYATIDGVTIANENKPYIYMEAFTKEAMTGMSLKLLEGRFPENETEILLPEHLDSNGKVTYRVGDSITLNLGKRYVKDHKDEGELTQSTQFMLEEEEFDTTSSQTYTVVGIMERPQYEGYTAPGYSAVTYLDEKSLQDTDLVTAYAFLDSVAKNIYDAGSQMAAKLGISEEQVIYNDSLLRYYGVSRYDGFTLMINGLAVILVVIIMVGSISLIYNSFAISISERSKQFGMLASVGATKRQKRNAVLYEGAVIGAIAIPIGILSGIFGMWITFRIVGRILTEALEIDTTLRLCVSGSTLVITCFVSAVTIYVSAWLPAKKASRITPLEAIRQSKDITIKGKTVKTNPVVRRCFGLEGELALKNLKRNKRRFRALVFSLIVSFVLFTGVSSYVYYLSRSMNMYMEDMNYDMYVRLPNDTNQDALSILTSVKGVEKGERISDIHGAEFFLQQDPHKQIVKKEYLTQLEEKYRSWGSTQEEIQELVYDNLQLYVNLNVLEDESYHSYLEQIGVKGQESNQTVQGVLINAQKDTVRDSMKKIQVLDVKPNEVIHLGVQTHKNMENATENGEEEIANKKVLPITIAAVSDQLPMGAQYDAIGGTLEFVIPESTMKKIIDEVDDGSIYLQHTFFFTLNQPEGIEQQFDTVIQDELGIKSGYHMFNHYTEAKRNHQLTMAMSIFAYGFITLISLICMANLCNTISTSFALRRREFAMLKSVGMTPRSFQRMIYFESMFYGIQALLYGIPIGVGLTLWIYKVVDGNFSAGFSFPVMSFVIGILAIILVVGGAMTYSSHKLKKDSIIDALKSEII